MESSKNLDSEPLSDGKSSFFSWFIKICFFLISTIGFVVACRYELGINIDILFFIGFSLCGSGIYLTRNMIFFEKKEINIQLFILTLLTLSVYTTWRMKALPWGGFPTVGGWDSGTHVSLKNQFVGNVPKIYEGFVWLYGLIHLLQKLLGLSNFKALLVCHWIGLFWLNTIISFVMAVKTASIINLKSTIKNYILCLILGVFILDAYILPEIYHYFGEGFYAHLFSFYVYLGLLLPVIFAKNEIYRIAFLVAQFIVMRYAYGLNLGDLMLVLSINLLLLLKKENKSWLNLGIVTAFVCSVTASYVVYSKLYPLIEKSGGFYGDNIDRMNLALLLLFGVLLNTRAFFSDSQSGWERVLSRICIQLAFFSIVVHSLIVFGGYSYQYYFFKYTFLAKALLLIGGAIIIKNIFNKFELNSLFNKKLLPSIGISLIFLVAVIALRKASGIRMKFLRNSGIIYAAEVRHFVPVYDHGIEEFIDNTLKNSHSEFAGFLTPHFAMSNFVNSNYGVGGYTEFWLRPTISSLNKKCVFWIDDSAEIRRLYDQLIKDDPNQTIVAKVAKLNNNPSKFCATYLPNWSKAQKTLCSLCNSNPN